MEIEAPAIQTNVPGPGGEPGLLLFAPRDEALEWDIRDEIVSTSRYWIKERQAWWIAAPYRHTAEDIVRRYAPPSPSLPSLAPEVYASHPEPLSGAAAAEPISPVGWDRLVSLVSDRWRSLEARLRRTWRTGRAADSA